MKLSFSVSSKSSSNPPKPPPSSRFVTEELQSNNSNSREFVKEFDSSKTLADDRASLNRSIIPPLPNEWRPLKKMKNLDLPGRPNGEDLQFEVEAPSSVEIVDTTGMSFGLNIRCKTISNHDDDKNDVVDDDDNTNNDDDKERVQQRSPFVSVENTLLQKLKDDLERLPEHRGMEEFDDCPVEGFGAAVLAGYGWVEGRGIGKNVKEDVKSVQYDRKFGKEGLGFVADAPKRDDDKEKERSGSKKGNHKVGKDVRIIRGRDMGCKGRIVEVLDRDSVVLKLSRSEDKVQVQVTEIADLGSEEEEKCLRKLKGLKAREPKHDNRSSRDEKTQVRRKESTRSRDEEGRGSSSSRREEEERVSRIAWLTSHIRVRIISKELKGGRLYLKKGEVVDVVGPNTCDISMDGSKELIQGVDQDLLETALPRRGEPVLVLYGKHKGIFGHLVEKDVDRETGVIRDADTHDLLNVKLEQIAEFIGDPSLIGY